ncbi:hypothetical protein CIB48_g1660 [Xylaria polymorpha]|nr:hypothetical protein CIB48_g1660 [Xylaria polymorpha]
MLAVGYGSIHKLPDYRSTFLRLERGAAQDIALETPHNRDGVSDNAPYASTRVNRARTQSDPTSPGTRVAWQPTRVLTLHRIAE